MGQIRTPYIYNHKALKDNLKEFDLLKKKSVNILYALKANNHEPIVQEVIKSGYGFDVASKEEIQLIIAHGGSAEKISFSAPSKFPEDVDYASRVGVKMFSADSEEEIRKITRLAKNPNRKLRIGAPSKAAAFNLSEKFGMTEKYSRYILNKSKKERWNIVGISFHIGSQNKDIKAWRKAIHNAINLIYYAKDQGIEVTKLNLGGGIPAKYTADVKPLSFYIKRLTSEVKAIRKLLPNLNLFLEPGRAMVANTMTLYASIIDIKPYKRPPLLILDTSVFAGVIEALEHFEYPLLGNGNGDSLLKTFYKVGGYSCDGYDIIRQRVLLPRNIKIGDILKLEQAGAYTSVFERFQMKPFPKIYNVK